MQLTGYQGSTSTHRSRLIDRLVTDPDPHGVYPVVLDVHSRVSHGEGEELVHAVDVVHDVYPDVLDCQHQVSCDENIDVYPGMLDVHSRVSHCEGEELVPTVDIIHDVYPDGLDSRHQVSRVQNNVVKTAPLAGVHLATAPGLNVDAASFVLKNPSLVHRGVLIPDLTECWEQVQRVQAGGAGDLYDATSNHWDQSGMTTGVTATTSVPSEPVLPFQTVEDIPNILGIAPKQVYKVNSLRDMVIKMPGKVFTDKVLPSPVHKVVPSTVFTPDYYVALHNIVAAPGFRGDGTVYDAFTPNHIGARITLPHVKLNIERWRFHLRGYEHSELVQYMEYGFPLGLQQAPNLESSSRNHGSAYGWYDYVDKFISKEVTMGGMTGPFNLAPWWDAIVSPLMTAHKKPLSRRTVFDATFGDHSLNNATPTDVYMGQPCQYSFPKIEDYKRMILEAGPGCWMWKRDLARFFLQLPLDPSEYRHVCVVWRGLFFFFLALAFGLRHSGLNGQKVTDALSWILRRLGLDHCVGKMFNCCNYVDDMGGVEKTKARAEAAFKTLGWLLEDLGLEESTDKAEAPTQRITYLGVMFDSVSMTMSVPPEKLTEIKSEIGRWVRRTTISKKELQSLLGKLFWVAKVVMHARAFMGRLLHQLRSITSIPDNKKVKLLDESKKDILWWSEYLDRFNGINMLVNDDPIPLSLEQLLDSPYEVCAGDATPTGGGAWHGNEYWSEELPRILQDPSIPIHLKEFWVMIVSSKLWGGTWTGRCIVLYCDNDAVVETVHKKKPKDPALLSLLREFLFVVVTEKFFPVVRKIGTKENDLADFISRRFDPEAAATRFSKSGLNDMQLVKPKTRYFEMSAKW